MQKEENQPVKHIESFPKQGPSERIMIALLLSVIVSVILPKVHTGMELQCNCTPGTPEDDTGHQGFNIFNLRTP